MRCSAVFIISFSTLFFLNACADPCKDLDGVIFRAITANNTIDKAEWNEILTYIEENGENLEDCYEFLFSNNKVDPDKVENYIQDLARMNRRLISPISIERSDYREDPITFKFYLESSVSVWYYDQGDVHGEFKHAIVNLLNNINRVSHQDNLMYIVNTVVEPYHQSYHDFIIQNDIFASLGEIGNVGQTDFENIFSSILSDLDDNDIAIMVSDLIYSTPNMTGKTTRMITNEVEGLMQSVFNRYTDTVSVLVIKLLSSYHGRYFFFDPVAKKEQAFPYKGDRPYYFTFIAKNEAMQRFLTDETYQQVRNFPQLNRFQNLYLFQGSNLINPYYSILINHPETKANYRIPRNRSRQIIGLERVKPLKNSNEVRMSIGVDLSGVFSEESFKINKDNYELSNPNFEILSIKPIGQSDYRGQGSSTHVMVIRSIEPTGIQGDLSISMKNILPPWIYESSTIDDTSENVPNFNNTTFAFEQMMNGVYKAFHPIPENARYFTLTLNFSK